ncbi:hypothetical protein CLCR_10707 [Cladophialophora carrionii]|uniref:Uncharacterized protein n=1 Tax=Cladophialophora carrionii TaxID=86049 RepID=A0A1C1CV31_9EURO|nr:hypothetical protein CLCR_10707 [Cladophialophora carrionii]
MSPFQPDGRDCPTGIKIEADGNDPFGSCWESQTTSGAVSMDIDGGRISGRQQDIAFGNSDPRQNTSVRRRLAVSHATKLKEALHNERGSDQGRSSKSCPPEDWIEPQNRVGGATLQLQPPSEAGQHQGPHTENVRESAPASVDVHMSLQPLASRLQVLKEEDAKLQQDEAILTAQVKDSEAACGRMIQQYLEIARAIATRQQHIQEDKARLEGVQQSRNRIETEVTAIIARIASSVHPGGSLK